MRASWDGTSSCEHGGAKGGCEWAWDGTAVKLGSLSSSFCNRSINNREEKQEKLQVERNTKNLVFSLNANDLAAAA